MSMFGSFGGGFGAAAPQPGAFQPASSFSGAFGATNSFAAPTQSTFGAFGAQPAAPAASAFGATGFGAPAATAFGAAPAANSFALPPAQPAFGAANTGFGATAFGQPAASTFGAPAAGAFGAPAPSGFGAFGGTTSNFSIGAPAAGTSTFGQPQPSGFGAFGAQPAASTFGASPFGAAGSTFGTASTAGSSFGTYGAGGQLPPVGTKGLNFQPFQMTEKVENKDTTFLVVSIVTGPPNEKSFEELRWEDMSGQTFATPSAAAPGAFGMSTPSATGFGVGTGAFTSPSTGGFGASTAFGAGGFGAGSTSFLSTTPTTGFGTSSSFSLGTGFGAQPASSSSFGAFGSTSSFSSTAFGTQSFGTGFGTPSTAGAFSTQPAGAATSFPSFGSFTTPPPASGSTFGTTGFGASNPAAAWGTTSFSSFGTATATAPAATSSYAPAAGFGFGASSGNMGSFGFGATGTTSSPGLAFPSFSQPAATSTYATGFGAPTTGFSFTGMSAGSSPGFATGYTTGVAASPVSQVNVDADPYGAAALRNLITSNPVANSLGLSQSDALQQRQPTNFRPTPRPAARLQPRRYAGGAPTKDYSVLGEGAGPQILASDIVLVSRRNLRTLKNVSMPKEVEVIEDPAPQRAGSPDLSNHIEPDRMDVVNQSDRADADQRNHEEAPRDPSPSSALRRAANGSIAKGTNGSAPSKDSSDDGEDDLPAESEAIPSGPPALGRQSTPFPGIPPSLIDNYESYILEPPLEQLERMSRVQLERIQDFRIRSDYGEVKWFGATNVNGLDIDACVKFAERSVEIYPEESQKPPVGQGLNKPARVTLYRVFPKVDGRNSKDPARLDAYEKKLRASTKDAGTKFVSYNKSTGEWTFDVEHF